MPYDPRAPMGTQVAQSFASSLDHLGVETIDAYLLHGPSVASGLAEADLEAWGAMEAIHDDGRARLLGISNVAIDQLEALHTLARVKPSVVQNRTFTRPQADREVRDFCRDHEMAYEGFSLLTAIPHVLAHPALRTIAMRLGRTPAEIVFAWCLAQGMSILTGTTSAEHMAQDLSAYDIPFSKDDAEPLGRLMG